MHCVERADQAGQQIVAAARVRQHRQHVRADCDITSPASFSAYKSPSPLIHPAFVYTVSASPRAAWMQEFSEFVMSPDSHCSDSGVMFCTPAVCPANRKPYPAVHSLAMSRAEVNRYPPRSPILEAAPACSATC